MSRTVSPSAKRAYGLGRVCRTWGLSRATIWRHRRAVNLPKAPRRRPGPARKLIDHIAGCEPATAHDRLSAFRRIREGKIIRPKGSDSLLRSF